MEELNCIFFSLPHPVRLNASFETLTSWSRPEGLQVYLAAWRVLVVMDFQLGVFLKGVEDMKIF